MEDSMSAPCMTWREKLAALHPDDLSPTERAALDAHMVSCPMCAATFADYKEMDSLIRKVFLKGGRPLELPEWLMQDDLAAKLPLLPVPRLYQNLPPRFDDFLGRQIELVYMMKGLNSFHSLLVIEGMGGVGKTTLAIELAYQCLQGSDLMPNSLFDAAVWISAAGRMDQRLWLSEVLNTITRVLDYPSIAQLHFGEKRTRVNELLRVNQTLVIIDNFDTITDPDLFIWMQQIPEPSKVLVTSRDAHQLHQAWTLHLKGLEGDDALEFIRRRARKLELSVIESVEVKNLLLDLVRITCRNPQAIAMILGCLKRGELGLYQVLDGLHNSGDILDHLFTSSWTALARNPDAQQVLLAMSFFAGLASKEALGAVVGMHDVPLEKNLMRLVELSLIEVYNDGGKVQARYGLHPLARVFISSKLKEVPDWEQEARKRWIEWWLAFTKAYGGPDGIERDQQYNLIEEEWENLLIVCEWCAAHDQYETLWAFWNTKRPLWMTSIYGRWKERLFWLRWIGKAAEKRGDKATALEATVEQGCTLTQMGQGESINELLAEDVDRHFPTFAKAYEAPLRAYTRTRGADPSDVDDIPHDSLVEMYLWLKGCDPQKIRESNLKGYLYRIAENCVRIKQREY